MLKKNIVRVALPLMALLMACNGQVVFEESRKIESKGWHIADTLIFEKEINDTIQLFDIFLNLRNNTEYPYRNLYVFFSTHFPDGRIFKDTIEVNLADRHGNWTGKGFGSIRSNSFHFRQDVWFPVEGRYRFTIQQGMRHEYLKGITEVGMRIERK